MCVDVDGDAEVDADLADGVAEILEDVLRVGAGVADDDAVAAAQHHLVQAEVLEVPAVGEVDVRVACRSVLPVTS